MSYDPVDTLGQSIASMAKGIGMFAGALWIGCGIAFMSIEAGRGIARLSLPDFSSIWAAPALLLSVWLLANVFVIPLALLRFMKAEGPQLFSWCVFAAVESLFAMLGHATQGGPVFIACSWALWLGGVGAMLFAGYLLHQWLTRQWNEHLLAIHTENERRRASQPTRPGVAVPVSPPHAAPPRLSPEPRA